MLILTRKIGETICIGHEIEVTVLKIDGGQVRIGVTAPRTVSVDRQEIHTLKLAHRIEGLERLAADIRRDRGEKQQE